MGGKSSALNEYKAVLLLSHQRKEKKNKKIKCAHQNEITFGTFCRLVLSIVLYISLNKKKKEKF